MQAENGMTPRGNWDRSTLDYALGIGIAIGAGLGMLFGLLLGNIAMGTAGGVVAGLLVGLVIQAQASAKDEEPGPEARSRRGGTKHEEES